MSYQCVDPVSATDIHPATIKCHLVSVNQKVDGSAAHLDDFASDRGRTPTIFSECRPAPTAPRGDHFSDLDEALDHALKCHLSGFISDPRKGNPSDNVLTNRIVRGFLHQSLLRYGGRSSDSVEKMSLADIKGQLLDRPRTKVWFKSNGHLKSRDMVAVAFIGDMIGAVSQ